MNREITDHQSSISSLREEKARIYCNLQKEEWLVLVTTLSCCGGVLATSIYLLVEYYLTQTHLVNFSLLVVLAMNCCFLVYYLFNGILNDKEYDLMIGYTVSFVVITSICAYEYAFHYFKQDEALIKLIRLLICFSLCPISIYVIFKLARVISWTEFKIVGASDAFQDIFRQAGFFMSLLKTDFQLSICLLVLELNRGPYLDSIYSKAVLIVGAPVCVAHLIIGYKAVRLESKTLTNIYICGLAALPAFIGYQLFKIYGTSNQQVLTADQIIIYAFMGFSAICLVSKFILLIEIFYVKENYNQGLIERAFMLESNRETQPLLYRVKRRKVKLMTCC